MKHVKSGLDESVIDCPRRTRGVEADDVGTTMGIVSLDGRGTFGMIFVNKQVKIRCFGCVTRFTTATSSEGMGSRHNAKTGTIKMIANVYLHVKLGALCNCTKFKIPIRLGQVQVAAPSRRTIQRHQTIQRAREILLGSQRFCWHQW